MDGPWFGWGMKILDISFLLIFFMLSIGCASRGNDVEILKSESIRVYGINDPSPITNFRRLGKVSSVSFSASQGEHGDIQKHDLELRKKALLLGANAVINVSKKLDNQIESNQFGEIMKKVVRTTGDAVINLDDGRQFLTPRQIRYFNEKILGLTPASNRDIVQNLGYWRFFKKSDGTCYCKNEIDGEVKAMIAD